MKRFNIYFISRHVDLKFSSFEDFSMENVAVLHKTFYSFDTEFYLMTNSFEIFFYENLFRNYSILPCT